MKITRIFVAALSLLALSACKTVEIEDGRVPGKYLSQAKKLEGIYKGNFNGVAGDLIISFEGDKPVVTYRNPQGTDILNNNCGSSFGNLQKVTVKSENRKPRVSNALFAFNIGNCGLMVQGRHASLSFKETNNGLRATVSILDRVFQREVCHTFPGNPPHTPPTRNCTWESTPVYLYGKFYR